MPPPYDGSATASAIYAYALNDPINGSDPNGHDVPSANFMPTDWQSAFDTAFCGVTCSGHVDAQDISQNIGKAYVRGAEQGLLAAVASEMGGAAFGLGGKLLGFGKAATRISSTAGSLGPRLGKEFETLANDALQIGPKETIIINGRTRVLDGSTKYFVTEIKNVAYQSYTRQIRDLLQFAKDESKIFRLIIRPNTSISKSLAELARSGQIQVVRLGERGSWSPVTNFMHHHHHRW